MQTAGRRCTLCGERVIAAVEARGCVRCNAVIHDRCLAGTDDPARCPECGTSLAAAEEPDREITTRRKLGKAIAVSATTVALSLMAVITFHAYLGGHVLGVARLAIAGLIFYLMFRGREWARVLAGLGCLVQASLAFLMFGVAGPSALILGTAFAACGVALLLDPRVILYLQDQGRKPV